MMTLTCDRIRNGKHTRKYFRIDYDSHEQKIPHRRCRQNRLKSEYTRRNRKSKHQNDRPKNLRQTTYNHPQSYDD